MRRWWHALLGLHARMECDIPDFWERVSHGTAEGYRLRERLLVHEARTAAELESAVLREPRRSA